MVEVSVVGRYKIEIYNIQGKLVNTLSCQFVEAVVYFIDWFGKAYNSALLPGEVYIIRLSGENQHSDTRVIILNRLW
jgi:hypothetical protein